MKPPDDYSQAIFIVTGSQLRAEELDRPLAYRIKEAADVAGAPDPLRRAVVLSDLFYLNALPGRDRPVVSVGGPRFNAVTRALYTELAYALAVDNAFMIQMDVALNDLRAAVWGVDYPNTVTAVEVFIEKYLDKFLAAAWEIGL
jgi:hypothetical protein